MRVELLGVSKVFGSLRVLNKLRLELEPGSIYVILGANGAGKSTLLQLLAGLLTPTEGQIYYNDEEFNRDRMDLRQHLFFMPDFPVVFANATVLQHISIVLRFFLIERDRIEEEVLGLLEEFDLLPQLSSRFFTSYWHAGFWIAGDAISYDHRGLRSEPNVIDKLPGSVCATREASPACVGWPFKVPVLKPVVISIIFLAFR